MLTFSNKISALRIVQRRLDIFNAPDNEAATQVSALIRTYGRAHSKEWPATEWARFKELLRGLPVH